MVNANFDGAAKRRQLTFTMYSGIQNDLETLLG